MAITLETEIQTLYTIALRGLVIFPCGTASFEIGRKKSVNAFKAAFKEGQDIFLVPQQDPSIPDPRPADLMNTGVIAKIDHFVPLNDGGLQIIEDGVESEGVAADASALDGLNKQGLDARHVIVAQAVACQFAQAGLE